MDDIENKKHYLLDMFRVDNKLFLSILYHHIVDKDLRNLKTM